jgi:hypothetical protein
VTVSGVYEDFALENVIEAFVKLVSSSVSHFAECSCSGYGSEEKIVRPQVGSISR